ncbi:MAG: spore coat protein [Brevinematales bacterium]|jgi:spore coat polysaccharide biosynthesis protein SpsF (cytidylyltransferase family)
MIMETDVIIQARLDSTRLPEKVILNIGKKSLIAWIVERLTLSQYIRNIIIATTDDSLKGIKRTLKDYSSVKYFTGSKANVLERYYQAAELFGSKIIVRATGDNPLVCPEFLDKTLEYHEEAGADLTHFLGIPLGTGVEVISRDALSIAYKNARSPYDLEHVTPFIYKNRDSFKVLEPLSSGFYYSPDIRVTVDTPADLAHVRQIFDNFKNKAFISMEDIISYHKDRNKVKTFYPGKIPVLA